MARRFLDLARILRSDQPPGEADWKLARASVALTLGILAREDEQVAEMMADREDALQEWLLATLNPKRSGDSRQRPVKRRTKRNR